MGRISSLFGALILAIGVVSCGGGDTPVTPPPVCPNNTFCMTSVAFVTAAGTTTQPVTLTILANTAVTWTNDSAIPHDVTFDDPATALAVGTGSAGNIPLHSSGSNQRKFTTTGNHTFYCTIHGTSTTGMRGIVIVQ
jgi:plastocyanin